MRLFLGIDGGQSSTIALIGDETGRVLGSGAGGPCNHASGAEGRAKFLRAMTESVGAACTQAGLDRSSTRFAVLCAGFSGGAEDKQELLKEVVQFEQLVVNHDAMIALVGATGGEPGIIMVAGTGSIAFGRNGAGKSARAGGWGYAFGDEGAGFDLARKGLRACLRQEEGWGPRTALYELFLETGQTKTANELLHRFYTPDFPRPRVASFSVLVERAAVAGDEIARELLLGAAADLSVLAQAVQQQLFAPGDPVNVAYMGGVFRSATVRGRFKELVEQTAGTRCGPARYAPAAGALIEAYRTVGLDPALRDVPDVKH